MFVRQGILLQYFYARLRWERLSKHPHHLYNQVLPPGNILSRYIYSSSLFLLLCRWYDKHLQLCSLEKGSIDRVSIVLLTNDKANQQLAQQEGIEAYTSKFH